VAATPPVAAATVTAAATATTTTTAVVLVLAATAAGIGGLRADEPGSDQGAGQQSDGAAPRLQVRAFRVLVLRQLIELLEIHWCSPRLSRCGIS
jgi:hypothetical protein